MPDATFEYANPKTVREAVGLLGKSWEDANVLAGGTDLLSLLKDYIQTPKRVVSLKGIRDLEGLPRRRGAAYPARWSR